MSINIVGYPGVASNITFLSQCTPALCPIELAVVNYVPSLEANALFIAIFAVFFILQTTMVFFYKTYSYSFALCLGLCLEMLGYLARVQMRFSIFIMDPFIAQFTCLTMAPVFYTAALYVTLSRIIVHFGARNSRLSPMVSTMTFVSADLIALILQSVGGGVANNASTLKDAQTGVNIMVAGLVFQVFSLTCFVSLCAEFFWNVKNDRRQIRNTNWAARRLDHPSIGISGFRTFLAAFMFSTILIFVRAIFRVAELVHGFESALANNQAAFMVFEGGIMIIATFMMTLFHPGRFIGDKWKELGRGLQRKNEVEMKAYEEMDPKPVEKPVFSRPWPI